MKLTNKNMRKGFTLVELLVVIAIIAALAAMATPVIMKQQKKAAMTTATSNAKQVFYLFIDFDQEYGHFPDAADSAGLGGGGGSTANGVLRQLFLAGLTKSEEIFFAKASFSKKPDGDVGTASGGYNTALDNGECGFVYMDDQSSGVNSARPILAAPLLNNSSMQFDVDMYGGKAISLRVDGSVQQYRINETNNQAVTKIGGTDVDIFSTQNPAWQNGTPTPLYPSKKGN
ncbi:MAG: prepilin-type N-terminal cleavage/methylation domain-containing protein [Akkermansiaceae bacterium]